MRKTTLVSRLFSAGCDYFFPRLCVLCDAPRKKSEPWLCDACIEKLTQNFEKRIPCPLCGQNSRRARCACESRGSWTPEIASVYALFDFDPVTKDLLHQIKYRGKKRLATWTGAFFYSRIPGSVLSDIDAIVPVPLHKKREKARGYNQSLLFAAGIASAHGGIPVLPRALRRVRNTVTQTALNRDRRMENIKGAFALFPGADDLIKGKQVLLVDDVVTTGVTTGEAAKALFAGGCAKVSVLSIARD